MDSGYSGTGKEWIGGNLGWTVDIVDHPRKPAVVWAPIGAVVDWDSLRQEGLRGVLPRRWVVERTLSWLGQSRRLSKDYEKLCETSENLIYIVMTPFDGEETGPYLTSQTVSNPTATLRSMICSVQSNVEDLKWQPARGPNEADSAERLEVGRQGLTNCIAG